MVLPNLFYFVDHLERDQSSLAVEATDAQRTGLANQTALTGKALWMDQLAIDSACGHSR